MAERDGAARTARPRPIEDRQTAPYWAAARNGELVVQWCSACDLLLHPSLPCCPWCLATDLDWHPVSGRGEVWSVCVAWAALVPGFAPPYVVADVALEEQPDVRLTANIVGPDATRTAVGRRVEVVFEDRGEGIVVPQFELVDKDA